MQSATLNNQSVHKMFYKRRVTQEKARRGQSNMMNGARSNHIYFVMAHNAIVIDLDSKYDNKPALPFSRPRPLSLTPPNGKS
jgi:hypothetical protein